MAGMPTVGIRQELKAKMNYNRIQLQPAYVLHRQSFRNTSLLVDFLSMDHGRLRLVARGARREKYRQRPLLQLFQPLLISFAGRGEVKTLTGLESGVQAIRLRGRQLFSGLYMNELLVRLLLNHDEHRGLYQLYQDTLLALQGGGGIEPALRRFELGLLAELGYGINLGLDCTSRLPIEPAALYRFTPDVGFRRFEGVAEPGATQDCFRGEHLLALRELQQGSEDDWQNCSEVCAHAAKRLLRAAISSHLGRRPLNSRLLYS